jgi:hypothetical protein
MTPPRKRSRTPETDQSHLQHLMGLVSSLQQQVSSLTSAPPKPLISRNPELIQISSIMGDFSFEVLGVDTQNEGVVVLLWDPKKPSFIPKGEDPVVIHRGDKLYRCKSDGLSMRLTLGDLDVLVAVLPLLESQG